ncbi:hypothetical protein [Treponema primitia]|uniref:hypothetical protein n=1 Tax=Treponema primitia TaxID=88058 RepID=UPI0002FFC9BA|nr:hypothetical protein [Treponema primitia]
MVEPKNWTLFAKTGLKADTIAEISADADELVALSVEGSFHRYCFDITIAHKSNVWLNKQGWPNEEQLFLDQRTGNNVSWSLGKRNRHVLYYEDPFGNQHHNGTMEIVTTYVLLEDGQEICYGDTGLPPDFSRNYIGPERGTFKACALSASASTMFVINEAGEMYTRLADFDTIGCDPMLFKYTYSPYISNRPGTIYRSNLTEWGLPAEDWRPQPRIPLAGKAAVTRHITILQNGQGNGARELRVAGLNETGETGYWTKAIFAGSWEFKTAPLYFSDDAILLSELPHGERGPSPDKHYSGFYWNGREKETGWEYAIPNFNILEGDCDIRITRQGETCTLKLYPVEMWTYLKRDYLPGRTGSPKMFMVTLSIPPNAFDGLSDTFTQDLTEKYAKNDKKLFQYTLVASNRYIIMRETGSADSVLYLTDGAISNQYPESQIIIQYIETFKEMQRYRSPELTLDNNTMITVEALNNKIALNRALCDELKYQIRALKWSQLTAFNFNLGYIPAHYIAWLTPLRFIDVPKIRTITNFGDRVILANSAYINTISATRILVYEKIVELLKLRILSFNEMVKEFSETQSNAAFPPWYSENIFDYWDIAGLPHTIAGTFFVPENDRTNRTPNQEIPAVLSFTQPESDPGFFGWYFIIKESTVSPSAGNSFSLYIDPLKNAKRIYSRKGKTPQERKLQLDCTLYIQSGSDTPIEQSVIDRSLKPFIDELKEPSINVRISFDGRIFEIKEYPPHHSSTIIFRGEF